MLICGNPVRPPRLTPFDRDGALRAWIRDADASGRERRIVHMLSQPNGLTLWQVGEALGSLSDKPRWENWTVKLPREPVGIGQGLVLWYRAWRECGSFSAFTGRVDGMLAQQLLDERLSPSALEDFGRCPLAFLLGRVLGVQERERDDADQVLPTTSGQWAHRALELMVQRRLTVTVEHVRQCVSQAMREHPAPGRIPAFHLKYHQDRLTSEVYEVLLRDEWDPSLKSEVESDLSWNWVWPLKGRIDRVDYLPDGTLRLVDYKSGYLANPDKPGPANLQLLLYQQALSNKTQRSVAAELVGISQRSEFTRRVVDPLKAQALTPVVSEIGVGMRQRLQSGEFFPIPDPRLDPCRRCAFELVCPARVADYARTKHAAAPAFAELWVGGFG
jgi:RecB family exonuclease